MAFSSVHICKFYYWLLSNWELSFLVGKIYLFFFQIFFFQSFDFTFQRFFFIVTSHFTSRVMSFLLAILAQIQKKTMLSSTSLSIYSFRVGNISILQNSVQEKGLGIGGYYEYSFQQMLQQFRGANPLLKCLVCAMKFSVCMKFECL